LNGAVEFLMLGPLEVLDGDRALPLGGRKQRGVLALLLLRVGEVVPRDVLIEELWQGRPPPAAERTLSSYLSRLRRAFGGEAERLLARGGGYALHAEPDEVDAARFEHGLAAGRRTLGEGDSAAAAKTLRAALALWRGPPLADLDGTRLVRAEVARLEELRLAGIELRADADLALGRDAELVGELESLVAANPLREGLRCRLMLALYRSGRQADALATYREARRALVDGLGIEPGPELRALERRILGQDATLDWKSAAPPGRRPALVGRARELAALSAGLDDAFASRGTLFLVGGEPGIGKTRLADELAAEAQARGARVLVGRCWEAGGAPAFWPWVQALRSHVRATGPDELRAQLGWAAPPVATMLPELRDLLPDVPAPVESEGARFRLFEATAHFLANASRAQPLVLVLDDVHAADEASLLLLRFVARELAGSRILVLGLYRDVDPALDDPLAGALVELAREPGTRTIVLAGLDEAAVAELVGLAAAGEPPAGLSAAVHAETDGNPLFVGEVVRLLAEDGRLVPGAEWTLTVPQTVKDAIGRRLGRLSPECNAMLAVASVLGRELDLDALERVSGAGLDALDEAAAARVVADVRGAPGRLRFAHALVRDAVYESLTAARRARLHREAGEALEELRAADLEPHLAELAHHFVAAAPGGDAAKAVGYARRAGDRAARVLAYEEAARLYRLALGLTRDGAARCELALAIGEAEGRAGATAAAKKSFREAAALAGELGLPEQLARAALGYGGRIVWDGSRDDDALVALLERALAAVGDGDSPARVRLLARLAGGPLRDARFAAGRRLDYGREALESARRLGDPATLGHALDGYVSSRHSPDFTAEQVALSTELVEVATAIGDLERAVDGREHRLAALLELGDAAAARADLDAMAALADELRQPAQRWYVAENRALFALLEGRFGEAETSIAAALELGGTAQRWNATFSYRLQLAMLRAEQGRLDELGGGVESWAADYPTSALWRCLVAWTGQNAAFEALVAEGFAALPFNESWLVAISLLADVAAALGERGAAAELYDRALPYADRVAVSYSELSTGAIARPLGVLAAATGRQADAERHFEDALELNTAIGARPWVARTQLDHAAMLSARGETRRAAELAARAAETRRELGLDVRPRPATPAAARDGSRSASGRRSH
jgi:DNA-binding SARP family transcriptional activator